MRGIKNAVGRTCWTWAGDYVPKNGGAALHGIRTTQKDAVAWYHWSETASLGAAVIRYEVSRTRRDEVTVQTYEAWYFSESHRGTCACSSVCGSEVNANTQACCGVG